MISRSSISLGSYFHRASPLVSSRSYIDSATRMYEIVGVKGLSLNGDFSIVNSVWGCRERTGYFIFVKSDFHVVIVSKCFGLFFITGLASDINMRILIAGLPKELCSICEKLFPRIAMHLGVACCGEQACPALGCAAAPKPVPRPH